MKIDWNEQRESFPVAKQCVYLMNASMTAMGKHVHDACQEYLTQLYEQGDPSWAPTLEVMDEGREILARLCGGKAADYGYGANTNHNMGLLAASFKQRFGPGNILISEDEFPASYVAWKYCGFEVRKCRGSLLSNLEKIDGNTRAVLSSSVHSFTGERVDIEALGKALASRSIPFIVNATQSLGHFALNVERSWISAMTCSSHKCLGAGYGAAILYVQESLLAQLHWPLAGLMSFDDPDFKGESTHAKSSTSFIELGALPFLSLIGMSASLKKIEQLGIENIAQRILELRCFLIEGCKKKGIEVVQSIVPDTGSGIVSLNIDNAKRFVSSLAAKNILVNERDAKVRVSLHYFNNFQDIKVLLQEL